MAFGQKNYADIQGINGKYRINQIGCFLTSFCNLLERFGMPVDPPTLNRIFIERGIYIDVDDGIRDDLGWQSVTAYNGQIATTVKSGGVTDRNSIVRIAASNSFGTHFCLVDRIENGVVYVVDSWDGQIKPSSVYGPITGWAVYTFNKPQPVTPIGDTMNQEAGIEMYRTALHRDPESAAGAGQWNGLPPAEALRRVRGAEWQILDNKLKAYDTLQSQVAELSTRPTKDELQAVIQTANTERDKVAALEAALAAEKAKPPVKETVEVVKEVVKNPSWLNSVITFINNLLRSK